MKIHLLTLQVFCLKGAVKTGAKKATQEATNLLTKMDLQFFTKGTNKYMDPWIQKSAYKAITDKLEKRSHKFCRSNEKRFGSQRDKKE
ncbi:hypothetical protein [Brevibacillus laterosporus]|uniref:Uncharacterized protein n=1 Tax=Brevibacillus laterosporus TaxID=1465 RepID=A0AAP3DHA3_BRELA|nr:hypothetical protein [Brevibacillus laterosporus]MCR8980878.1 hypothetical protein [Brevibacillus laterosporus]MCZ0808033.1 hypothetical protein [Brevibacillus laterosporus]MCZ0826405.1 hypothetical protein [Brevibacillus laterosporus]MCZ0852461.1 hypothetical protein [Brevibacillus laterosporus]